MHSLKIIIAYGFFVLLLPPAVIFAETAVDTSRAVVPAATEAYEFPAETSPLLPAAFFTENKAVFIPAGSAGLASGIILMILGIVNFSLTSDSGYGSVEMNRSFLLLNTGALTAALSAVVLKVTLAKP